MPEQRSFAGPRDFQYQSLAQLTEETSPPPSPLRKAVKTINASFQEGIRSTGKSLKKYRLKLSQLIIETPFLASTIYLSIDGGLKLLGLMLEPFMSIWHSIPPLFIGLLIIDSVRKLLKARENPEKKHEALFKLSYIVLTASLIVISALVPPAKLACDILIALSLVAYNKYAARFYRDSILKELQQETASYSLLAAGLLILMAVAPQLTFTATVMLIFSNFVFMAYFNARRLDMIDDHNSKVVSPIYVDSQNHLNQEQKANLTSAPEETREIEERTTAAVITAGFIF